MSQILKYLLSSILFVTVCQAQVQPANANQQNTAQSQSTDTTKVKKPAKQKVPKSFYIPTGARVGADLVGLGVSIFGKNRKRYEFQADVDFHRFYLAGSYGITTYNLAGDGFEYSHDGSYHRFGLDVDFLKHDPDHNTFTVGFRFARANFNENLTLNQTDSIFGSYSENLSNQNISAKWFEINTGLRVMILENLYTGYTFRIQLNRKLINADNFRSYDIPGYGRSEFGSRWTFNYYLMYRISWKEKGIMPREK